MTACVNKKSKRVAAVVTASLVGALSIGAPAVALAANANIDMLVADEVADFNNGKITQANGDAVSNNLVTFTANGNAIEVKPQKLTTATGVKVTLKAGDYRVSYVKADSEGKPSSEGVSEIVLPGKYFVKVEALAGDYVGGVAYLPVKVDAAQFTDLKVFEVNPADPKDNGDTKLVYTGKDLSLGLKNDDKTLVAGTDYDVKYLKAGSSIDADGVSVKETGRYSAVVTGKGIYAGEKAQIKDIMVDSFDLSSATITVDPVINSNSLPVNPTSVVWTDSQGNKTVLDPTLVKLKMTNAPGSNLIFDAKGQYTFFAERANEDLKNDVKYTQSVHVDKYATEATVQYDGEDWPASFAIDLNDKKPASFDQSLVKAFYGTPKTDINDISITATNADGFVVDFKTMNSTPGVYTVKVVTKSTAYEAAAVKTCTVTVKGKTVDADASVYVQYNNKTITSFVKDWDGNSLPKTSFTVKGVNDEIKDLESTLSTKLTNEKGEEVDSATDAGVYTLTVSSSKYELTGTTSIKITVNPLKLDRLVLKGGNVHSDFGTTYALRQNKPLTGLTLDYVKGVDVDGNGALDDYATVGGIASSKIKDVSIKLQQLNEKTGVWYDVNGVPAVDTKNPYEVLKFRFVVSPLNASALKNCVFATEDGTVVDFFALNKKLAFSDVMPSDWYYGVVSKASDDKLMNGYADTKIFGSYDKLTRGQVACVLFNMAGAKTNETELHYNEVEGFLTGFSDVNGKAYYGKAIAWAKQAGVVNGYGDGTFRPDAIVTREEFAAMLANFAKKYNSFTDVDADKVLGEFSDGASVSDWAEEVVAWAVDQKIMGNNGSIKPTDDIVRAEAAAMVINSGLKL